ncbi:hypothetical protein H4R21_001908 [Coemansia helicoidea]|uniref:Uncharacterized protein n=1 Tax=Coemansia helicoidea TaxID=1286919 RepID=A0ACC1LAR9_9FUNG|nr:hypothetical protein H4R21_001908 [Coemansia helicoidea]
MGNSISFSVTSSEQLRASLVEALTGLHVDPRGRGDAIMIIFFTALYALDLVAVVYILYNRNYPPLRCKSPILMAGIIVFAILWLVGDIQVNGHVPLLGTPWNSCRAFGFWISVVLGICTLTVLLALRTLGIMRVFIMGKPFRGLGLYLPFVAYAIGIVIVAAVVQALPAEKTMFYVEVADVCDCTKGLFAVVLALIWIAWIVVAVLSWRVRTIKSSFNEAREAAIGCFIVFSVLTAATVMHYALPSYVLSLRHRIITTCIDHVATHIYWWMIMGVPIFNCLFRRERYLREWTHKLMTDGLEEQYDVVATNTSVNDTLVERHSKGFSREAPPGAHYNDPHLGANHLGTPITDSANRDQGGDPISWPQFAEQKQATEPQPSKRRFRRW